MWCKSDRMPQSLDDLIKALFYHNIVTWNFVKTTITDKTDWSISLVNNFDFERNLTGVDLFKFRETIREGLVKELLDNGYHLVLESETELVVM